MFNDEVNLIPERKLLQFVPEIKSLIFPIFNVVFDNKNLTIHRWNKKSIAKSQYLKKYMYTYIFPVNINTSE